MTAVTFSFADPTAGLYGLARLGPPAALAVLCAGDEPVVERIGPQSLQETVDEPQRRWNVRLDDGFDVVFEATGPPAGLGAAAGSVQICRVQGTSPAGDVRGLGQRMHLAGAPIGSERPLGAWLDDGTGVAAVAVRPAAASHHEDEATSATLLTSAGALHVDKPRLSTTYDGAGRQRRATLELWVGVEDSYPRRASGEAVCGSTLDLGDLRLDCAFMRWSVDGRPAIGRYDLLRPA